MQYIKTNELYHHGVLGQKWGVRNGPPYPLTPEAHSAREKKAGYQQSIGGQAGSEGKKKVKRVTSVDNNGYEDTAYFLDSKIKDIRSIGLNVKESAQTSVEDSAAVNPKYKENAISQRYSMNCTNCVMAYALRRMGLDVEAQPNADGRDLQEMNLFFKGCLSQKHSRELNFNPRSDTGQSVRESLEKSCKELCGDDAGVGFIRIQGPYIGHVFSWEKLDNGKVIFIDPQSNDVDNTTISRYFEYMAKGKHLTPGALVSRLDDCNIDTGILGNAVRNHKER